MTRRTYASPEHFKQALEQRLRARGPSLARSRQLLVFDRFLARVISTLGDAVILKGGLVLELRLARARTTKDVDLRLTGAPAAALASLQAAGRLDLGDFMTFELGPDLDHPQIAHDGMRYEGQRFRAICRLAGRPFGDPFGVDVAFADPLVGVPDTAIAADTLAFAGVPPPAVRLYPVVTHLAEKLHAYTMPRDRPNSRIKDLPDIALLGSVKPLDAAALREALVRTFEHRRTHDLPPALPAPPAAWATPYAAIARADQLPWRTLVDVTSAAGALLDPVLGGDAVRTWDPAAWVWSASAP